MVTTQDLSLQPSDGVAFIVEAKDNLDFGTLRAQLLGFPGIGGNCEIEKLFESEDSDLARFAIVRFLNADPAISASPFDLAYKLKDEANFASVTPILVQEPPDHLGEWDFDCSEDHPSHDHEWHLKQMRVLEAWKLSKGEGVLIGHIDSGVTDHPEIEGSFLIKEGKNFVEIGKEPWDVIKSGTIKSGHGTATCSLAVAPGTGPQKFQGTAPKAKVVPYRAFPLLPVVLRLYDVHRIAKAIEAASEKCQVISMSLGGYGCFSCIKEAIKKATEKGIICVAAAGNVVFGNFVTYPGSDKNCIAVAGTTFDATRWKGSCRGLEVAISAPAQAVYCAKRRSPKDAQDLVETGKGTSFATACVAGIAALWLSYHGRDNLIKKYGAENLTRAFKTILCQTASHQEGWDTKNFGAGIVDAEALLKAPSLQHRIF